MGTDRRDTESKSLIEKRRKFLALFPVLGILLLILGIAIIFVVAFFMEYKLDLLAGVLVAIRTTALPLSMTLFLLAIAFQIYVRPQEKGDSQIDFIPIPTFLTGFLFLLFLTENQIVEIISYAMASDNYNLQESLWQNKDDVQNVLFGVLFTLMGCRYTFHESNNAVDSKGLIGKLSAACLQVLYIFPYVVLSIDQNAVPMLFNSMNENRILKYEAKISKSECLDMFNSIEYSERIKGMYVVELSKNQVEIIREMCSGFLSTKLFKGLYDISGSVVILHPYLKKTLIVLIKQIHNLDEYLEDQSDLNHDL